LSKIQFIHLYENFHSLRVYRFSAQLSSWNVFELVGAVMRTIMSIHATQTF